MKIKPPDFGIQPDVGVSTEDGPAIDFGLDAGPLGGVNIRLGLNGFEELEYRFGPAKVRIFEDGCLVVEERFFEVWGEKIMVDVTSYWNVAKCGPEERPEPAPEPEDPTPNPKPVPLPPEIINNTGRCPFAIKIESEFDYGYAIILLWGPLRVSPVYYRDSYSVKRILPRDILLHHHGPCHSVRSLEKPGLSIYEDLDWVKYIHGLPNVWINAAEFEDKFYINYPYINPSSKRAVIYNSIPKHLGATYFLSSLIWGNVSYQLGPWLEAINTARSGGEMQLPGDRVTLIPNGPGPSQKSYLDTCVITELTVLAPYNNSLGTQRCLGTRYSRPQLLQEVKGCRCC